MSNDELFWALSRLYAELNIKTEALNEALWYERNMKWRSPARKSAEDVAGLVEEMKVLLHAYDPGCMVK